MVLNPGGMLDPNVPVKVLVAPAAALILIEMAEAACRNHKCSEEVSDQIRIHITPTLTPRPLLCIRPPGVGAALDGDALSGFALSSDEPPGLLLRMAPVPRTLHRSNGCKLMLGLKPPPQIKHNLIRRRRCNVSKKYRETVPKALKKPYIAWVEVSLPRDQKVLDDVADAISEWNEREENAGNSVTPYLLQSVLPTVAALVIQAAARAFLCRRRLRPSLSERMLQRRAVNCIARWWRACFWRMHVTMLTRCRRLLDKLDPLQKGELCLTKPNWDLLIKHVQSPPVLKTFHELRIRYAFAEADTTTVFLITEAEPLLRQPIAEWLGVDIPSTTTEAIAALDEQPSIYGTEDVLPLLEQDVESADAQNISAALLHRSGLKPVTEAERPFKHFRFKSYEDARQRCALLFLLTYDPKISTGVSLLPDPFESYTTPRGAEVVSPPPLSPERGHRQAFRPYGQRDIFSRFHATFPDPNRVFGNEKGQRESQTGSMWYDSPWTKCADRDLGTSGMNGGAIPAHVLPFLPRAHTLVRFASLPLHLQYALSQASAPQSTVRLRVKNGDRDKHDHLQECLLSMVPAPHELRPTTPEIEVETYHKLVAQTLKDVMQKQELVTKAEMVEDLPTQTRAEQAALIREETRRLLEAREVADDTREARRRLAILENAHNSFGMLRSVNTSSLPACDFTTRDEVRHMARELKQATVHMNQELVDTVRDQSAAVKEVNAEDKQKYCSQAFSARAEGHASRMSAIAVKAAGEERHNATIMARRAAERGRKKQLKEDRQFVGAFGRQHMALAKQIRSAETGHLQAIDWHYTCREVDARRQASQQRKAEVEADLAEQHALKRELWLEKAAQTALAREELLLEMEDERQVAYDRAQLHKEIHQMYVPACPKMSWRRPDPEMERQPLLLKKIVSAD